MHPLNLTDGLTDWLIQWNTVLLEKPIGPQLVKKFLAFCGPRRLITAFRNLAACPCLRPDQSSPYLSFFWQIHFSIVLPRIPTSSKWSPSLTSPHRQPVCTSCLSYCMSYIPHTPPPQKKKIECSLNKGLQTWNFQNHFCHTKLTSFHILYEGESNGNRKSTIKIRNTARLSCKLTKMIIMVWTVADRWQYDAWMQHDGAVVG